MVKFIHNVTSDIKIGIRWILEKLIPILDELETNIHALDEAKNTNPVSRSLDTAFGTLLTISIVFGIPANFICCYFFSAQNSLNETGIYFKRLYTVTSSLFLVICVLLFPIIQVLLEGRQYEFLLFYDSTFCHVWYTVWLVCYQTAMFTLALITVSWILFSCFPNIKGKPLAAWLLPSIAAGAIFIFVITIPLARGNATISYKPVYSTCQIQGYPLDIDELEEIWEEFKEMWNEDVRRGSRIHGKSSKANSSEVRTTDANTLVSNQSEAKQIYDMCEEVADHVEEAFLNQL